MASVNRISPEGLAVSGKLFKGFHEKSRINPKRKNKIGKKKVDDKNSLQRI
jgi:hypothetical protein